MWSGGVLNAWNRRAIEYAIWRVRLGTFQGSRRINNIFRERVRPVMRKCTAIGHHIQSIVVFFKCLFVFLFVCSTTTRRPWLASQLIWLIIKLSFGKQSKPLPRNLLIANTQRIGLHCSNKINDTTMMCRAVCTIHTFLLNVNFRIYCTHNPIGVVDWESHHSIHIACLLGGKVCPINEIIMIGIENSLMQ